MLSLLESGDFRGRLRPLQASLSFYFGPFYGAHVPFLFIYAAVKANQAHTHMHQPQAVMYIFFCLSFLKT